MLKLCVFLALPSQLFAFEFLKNDAGTACRWDLAKLPAKTITWRLSSNAPAIAHESMQYACLNWTIGSAGTLQFAEGDGGVVVNWADPQIDASIPATTMLTTKGTTIVAATISVNTSSFTWMRGNESLKSPKDTRQVLDLDAILLHEMGHALGLNHSDENADEVVGATNNFDLPTMNSIVYPSARTLHLDDMAGIRKLYDVSAPLPELLVEASPASGKAPLKVALFQTGGGDETAWDLGEGTLLKGAHANARYRTPGFYTVTAESNGMTASVVIEVTKKGKKKAKK